LESAVVLLDVPAAIWVENLGSFSVGRKTLRTVPAETLADSLEGYGFELIGIGAAIENMWIAANALGLSAAFIGDVVVAESKIAEVLGLRGDLVGVLALGYSSSEPRPPMDVPTFDHLDRVVWHQGVVR
jgi:nitroreductase